MFNIIKETIEWAGRPLTFETGKMARQADGAILVTYGETTVLATVCANKTPVEGADFFPLTVNYQEKYYAAGKIPGGYFKREGRPTEKETLVSRLIDRPIRPLFAKGFRNDTQIITTVLAHDMENDPDIIALIASSAALTLSGVPFLGPIGAARIAYQNDEFIVNPTLQQMEEAELDLVVAGTQNAVMMVESEAKELSEDEMLQAVMKGHQAFQPVINAIVGLAERAAKEPWEFKSENYTEQQKAIVKLVGKELKNAYKVSDKIERQEQLEEIRNKVFETLEKNEEQTTGYDPITLKIVMKEVESDIVRTDLLKTKKRIDGRKLDEVRPIISEVGLLPRTHGSALFTRGETQALAVATLGTGEDEQFIDALQGVYKESFLLHYNFPPFSVGETGRIGATGRREIGHGKLAWRALKAILPEKTDFPYTIRLVSEILESNGSSSMATVCGCSLALMDAGVPIKRAVSGIAMGLIKEKSEIAILSDILGDEDHLGDMDFKVAGTEKGITSLQMDIKITGIDETIMKQALQQAHKGRIHILNEMKKALSSARDDLKTGAPRIKIINVPTDKIRDIIGSGGKTIREIVETTGAKIDINDDGVVKISSDNQQNIEDALNWIKTLTSEPQEGEIYDGTVVKIMDFGAFVNFFGSKDGLVHISQLADYHVKNPSDIVKVGDKVKVKLLGFDNHGKIRLGMKMVDQKTGQEISL